MASGGTTVERLRQYLRDLKPEARALLEKLQAERAELQKALADAESALRGNAGAGLRRRQSRRPAGAQR